MIFVLTEAQEPTRRPWILQRKQDDAPPKIIRGYESKGEAVKIAYEIASDENEPAIFEGAPELNKFPVTIKMQETVHYEFKVMADAGETICDDDAEEIFVQNGPDDAWFSHCEDREVKEISHSATEGFPDYMDDTEMVICAKLISSILSKGYAITVYDEEDEVISASTDIKTIQEATGHTGLTRYELVSSGDPIGAYLLIHGNGEDVISDCGWSSSRPESEGIINGIFNEVIDVAA